MATKKSPPLDDALIDRFLLQPESFRFDCKRIRKDLTSVLETVVAFANSEGGTIALGLEDPDKGSGRERVYGIDENETNWDEIQRLLRSRITEPDQLLITNAPIACTLRSGNRGSVVLLKVAKSSRVHSIVDDGTFVRLDKSNKQLTAAEINELCFARGAISAETQLEEVDFKLLKTDYWKGYARQRRLTRPIADAMQHLGLARRNAARILLPTRAAVLLFAEEPSGLLSGKAGVRIFHYKGPKVLTDPNTNLAKPPITVSGPLIRLIQDAKQAVVRELASGVQMGALGFEIVQRYPLRVINEAITNAVIHRDYRLPADIMVRIFSDHIEIESPGLLVGPVTTANINRIGPHNRNPLIVGNLREFPAPPNLDAGEGVRMMFGTMHEAGLYPPVYLTRPRLEREAVVVHLWNQNRPTAWQQVSQYVDDHGTIGNAEVRKIMGSNDTLGASKQLKHWVEQGLLVISNPEAGRNVRRYTKPDVTPETEFLFQRRKKSSK